jgi:hypothetical protein
MRILLVVVAGCGGALSAKEAQKLHVQNDSAQSRALETHGLTVLPGVDLSDGTTMLGDPTPAEFTHPTLGRTVVTVPHNDHVFAVDRQGVVHDVAIAVKYIGHEREHVKYCASATGGADLSRRPPSDEPAPQVWRRYVRLADGQALGPAIKLDVEYVELQPIYMTGRACREIP